MGILATFINRFNNAIQQFDTTKCTGRVQEEEKYNNKCKRKVEKWWKNTKDMKER
jgi:hypothetical protein